MTFFRKCFFEDFNTKCPICKVPVNTKDSLEDKLLKELLSQLGKLKQILENDSNSQNEVVELQLASDDAQLMISDADASHVEPAAKDTEVKVPEKISEDESFCPPKLNFSCSTPKVKRKKKMLPRPVRSSSIDDSIIKVCITHDYITKEQSSIHIYIYIYNIRTVFQF